MTDKKEEILRKVIDGYRFADYPQHDTEDAIFEAMDEYFNQAIEDALAEVQKYDTGKELSPLVKTLITKLKALKK